MISNQMFSAIFLFLTLFYLLGCQPHHTPKIEIVNEAPIPNDTVHEFLQPIDTHLGLVELSEMDSTIKLELRYASSNNFVSKVLYPCARCYLHPEVAKRLVDIQKKLHSKQLSLKLFDCYRPHDIQKQLWEVVPDARYVTPPQRGSMHNKGLAVDVTIIDNNGIELDMGTGFDYFGIEAYHTYIDQDEPQIQANRTLLKSLMEQAGLQSIRTEWWHYSLPLDAPILAESWDCPEQ